ncbi:hypothetical protein [Pricia sp.]|uniref:hypothetical protein n=1 Tax=Pricia sp. TaxID=2268138 RepID=UPI00359399E0
MRLFAFIFLGMMLLSGCKKDPPNPPGRAVLTEPAKNSECTPVQSSSGNNSLVRFRWRPGDYSESYEIVVKNLSKGDVIDRVPEGTMITIPLEKGTPYSWYVISKNTQTNESAISETWLFYNPGSQTDHVPFPAEIIAPVPGATVFKDMNNEIILQWTATDIDNDIESYTIYLSTENPPNVLIGSPSFNETSQKVGVISDRVYYWRVVTTDALGNTSDTGVLDFKVY